MRYNNSNQNKHIRNFIDLHKAHLFLSKKILPFIEMKQITSTIELSNICQKKYIVIKLFKNLMYIMVIKFNFEHVREFEFQLNNAYFVLDQVRTLIKQNSSNITFQFVIISNDHIRITMIEFMSFLFVIVSNYVAFYFAHSKSHYLQFEKYVSAENRSMMYVSASLTLNF